MFGVGEARVHTRTGQLRGQLPAEGSRPCCDGAMGLSVKLPPREGWDLSEGRGTVPQLTQSPLSDPVIFAQSQPPHSTAKLEWKVQNKDPTKKTGGGDQPERVGWAA